MVAAVADPTRSSPSAVGAPPAPVVEAFGGSASSLVPLPGGRGSSWRAGDVVLKRADDDRFVAWSAEVAHGIASAGDVGVRVVTPVRAASGGWTRDGWSATAWLEGVHVDGRWNDVLAVGRRFHAAVARAGVGWPDFLAVRTDPWSRADRVAWGDEEPEGWAPVAVALLDRLSPLLCPSAAGGGSQVVHADLAGNVLFADEAGLPPAVLDLSPQHRPTGYADAIVVADSVAWMGAPPSFAETFLATEPYADRLLARALVFRVGSVAFAHPHRDDRVEAEIAGYQPLLELLP